MTAAQRYIALLRAINVGSHIVKMERLRSLFDALGFGNVATFIASGNVIFDSPKRDAAALERSIERRLKQELGYDVVTFLRTPTELRAVVAQVPFSAEEIAAARTMYVAFLRQPLEGDARERLERLRTRDDDVRVGTREVYWLSRLPLSESAFSGALLEKTIGAPATLRNISTVTKLADKYVA
jgi:uncharacterized protein (DUF1697 family)